MRLKQQIEDYLISHSDIREVHLYGADDIIELVKKERVEYRHLEEVVTDALEKADIQITNDQLTCLITNIYESFFDKEYHG